MDDGATSLDVWLYDGCYAAYAYHLQSQAPFNHYHLAVPLAFGVTVAMLLCSKH